MYLKSKVTDVKLTLCRHESSFINSMDFVVVHVQDMTKMGCRRLDGTTLSDTPDISVSINDRLRNVFYKRLRTRSYSSGKVRVVTPVCRPRRPSLSHHKQGNPDASPSTWSVVPHRPTPSDVSLSTGCSSTSCPAVHWPSLRRSSTPRRGVKYFPLHRTRPVRRVPSTLGQDFLVSAHTWKFDMVRGWNQHLSWQRSTFLLIKYSL